MSTISIDGATHCRIANATEKDAGVYACIVGTREEHVKSVAHLNVEEGAEYIATSVARERPDSIGYFHPRDYFLGQFETLF